MTNKTRYLLISLFILLTTSCEKVVNIDLGQTEQKNVIDAAITENSPCIVLLTQSQGFYDNSPYSRISGARVELSDNDGHSEILEERHHEAGVYISSMIGKVGYTYTLKITVEDETYQAKATIPETVPIDSIYIYPIKMGNDYIFSPCVVFHDPAEAENFYYTMLKVNGSTMRSIYLNDDEFRNGLKVDNILFFDKEDNNDEALKVGDNLEIEMQTLDKGMYTFYKSLRSVAAGGGTNPLTNITGGALGCFKAYNSVYIDYTITEKDVNK